MPRPFVPLRTPARAALLMLAAFLGTSLFTGTAYGQEDAGDRPPNVIVLFVDDLGYGDLSSYGHPTIRTPHLDRLADDGMRLTSFYAQTWCVPSRAALLTGRHPLRIEHPYQGGVGSPHGLPPDEVTLAEVLQDAGYRTMMIGKWHLGYARDELLPTAQGFDAWYGLPYSNDMQPPWVQTDVPLRMYRDEEPLPGPVDQDTLTTGYTREATAFIRDAAEEPFFLYLAYSMVHLPVHTTERFRDTSRAGLYGDVVATIDWSVGRLRAVLEEEGLAEHTIVVFTSDNGPWLNLPERMLQGGVRPWHQGTTGPLRGAKHTAWEGGLRVPGIVAWPGRIPAGQVSAAPASTLDLLPTLAAAAGAAPPTGRPLDGRDLLPFLTGTDETLPEGPFFYSNHERLVGVRDGRWKLLVAAPGGEEAPASLPALYDLAADPGERYDVAADHPDVVRRLREVLQRFGQQVGVPPGE